MATTVTTALRSLGPTEVLGLFLFACCLLCALRLLLRRCKRRRLHALVPAVNDDDLVRVRSRYERSVAVAERGSLLGEADGRAGSGTTDGRFSLIGDGQREPGIGDFLFPTCTSSSWAAKSQYQ